MNNHIETETTALTTETGERSPVWGAILYQDFAGSISEFSALTKYFYQHLILRKDHPQLSEELLHISVAEMHHLKLLGELITNFGCDPKFRSIERCAENYWSADCLNYSRNLRYLLMENMKGEQKAIANYRLRLCQIKNPAVQKVLQHIIEEELEHIAVFERWLEAFSN